MIFSKTGNKPVTTENHKHNLSEHKKHMLAVMKNIGLFKENPQGISVKRALHKRELNQAYRLVHDQYVHKGYIIENPCGIRIRSFELSNNIATFIAEENDNLEGVCSLVIDSSDIGLPSDRVFKKELKLLREQSRLICEGTNQALTEKSCYSSVMTELLRCVFAQVLLKECDKFLVAVSAGHRHFYELNYFEQIGEERNYSEDLYDPVILMCADIDKVIDLFNNIKDNKDTVDGFMSSFYYTENPFIYLVREWEIYKKVQTVNTWILIKKLINIENENKIKFNTLF